MNEARALGILSCTVALLLALPLFATLLNVTQPASEIWTHVASILIPRYLGNTLILLTGVALGSAALGVGAAWLVVTYRFPGRRIAEWALILPLAIPSYVLAYVYYDLMAFSGPVQGTLRAITGWGAREYWFPSISSLGGAVFVLTLALYPYVYLAARAAFLQQATSTLEVSRMLGCSQAGAFFRVMLPLGRPAIVVGVSLVMMETLAEYGAVSLLGVQTFTTGIFRAWFSMGDRVAAAQLAVLLLGFVFALLMLERFSRRGRVFNPSSEHRLRADARLSRAHGVLALLACLTPITFGFLLPAGALLAMLIDLKPTLDSAFIGLAANSLAVGAVTAFIAVSLALLMVYGARLAQSRLVHAANRAASLGYAIPGPVIAIGTLVPLAALDNVINDWLDQAFGFRPGLILTGSIAALVFAYLVRFMTVALGTVEAGFDKVRPSLEDAASTLGMSAMSRLKRVHAPLIWPSLATATLLVFVDVMKELPATLILRPFDFNTLAVKVYDLARDERLAEAALPALALVLVGLLPVFMLSRQIARDER